MWKDEKGLTLVEVLATLTLISLVTGLIWSTISIATQFNVSETTNVRVQQEANHILTELQSIHRNCYEYRLTITQEKVAVNGCEAINGEANNEKVISDDFRYVAILNKTAPNLPSREMEEGEEKDFQEINKVIESSSTNLVFTYFAVEDINNDKRYVNIPTTISRYKTSN